VFLVASREHHPRHLLRTSCDKIRPTPRKQKTLHDIQAIEVTEYHNLHHRWTTELTIAEESNNAERITNATKP
jgi:hypothetical protein